MLSTPITVTITDFLKKNAVLEVVHFVKKNYMNDVLNSFPALLQPETAVSVKQLLMITAE